MNRKTIIYIGLILIATVLVSVSYFSYAFFTNRSEQRGKLNIVAGTLNYKLEIEDFGGDSIEIPGDTTMRIILKITSLNDIDTKYYVNYHSNEQASTAYYERYSDGECGIIHPNETITVPIIIQNEDQQEDDVVDFYVNGGLVSQDYSKIKVVGYKVTEGWETETLTDLIFTQYPKENVTFMPSGSALKTYLSSSVMDEQAFFASTDTNSGNPTYFFRGNNRNNFVWFAGGAWRIVRINEDGTIRLISEGSIGNSTSAYRSNATQYSFENSDARVALQNWYDRYIASDAYYSKLIATKNNYFCVGDHAAASSDLTDDEASYGMVLAKNYYPTFTCHNSSYMQEAGTVNTDVGLITYDEAIFAGYMPGWSDLNYDDFDCYLRNSQPFWTMSPAGIPYSTHKLYNWVLDNGVTPYPIMVENAEARLRPVINLKADVRAYKPQDSNYYTIY